MKYKNIINKIEYLKLDIDAPFEEIKNELFKVNYKYKKQNATGWELLALRGIDIYKCRPYQTYGYKFEDQVPYIWTDLAKACPISTKFLKESFYCNKIYRVKLNILKPFGLITPHRDSKDSILGLTEHPPYSLFNSKEIKYITIVIDWPKNNPFFYDDKRIPINNGDVFLIDFSKKHSLINLSLKNCYSFVLTGDFKNNKKWEKLVERSYKKNYRIRPIRLSFSDKLFKFMRVFLNLLYRIKIKIHYLFLKN